MSNKSHVNYISSNNVKHPVANTFTTQIRNCVCLVVKITEIEL